MDLLRSISVDVGGLLNLRQQLEDGEVTQEQVSDAINSITCTIEQKTDMVVDIMSAVQGDIATLDAEIKRLQLRKQSYQGFNDSLKNGLTMALNGIGVDKVRTTLHTVSIANNGGKQKLDIFGAVSDAYCTIEVVPDKDKIRKALEDGKKLDFAMLCERGKSLRIK